MTPHDEDCSEERGDIPQGQITHSIGVAPKNPKAPKKDDYWPAVDELMNFIMRRELTHTQAIAALQDLIDEHDLSPQGLLVPMILSIIMESGLEK